MKTILLAIVSLAAGYVACGLAVKIMKAIKKRLWSDPMDELTEAIFSVAAAEADGLASMAERADIFERYQKKVLPSVVDGLIDDAAALCAVPNPKLLARLMRERAAQIRETGKI